MGILCAAMVLAGCRRRSDEASAGPPPRRIENRLLEPNSFAAIWTKDIDVATYGAPRQIFARDDLAIVYTDQNVVYVLSAAGGRTVWVSRDVVRPLDRLWPPVLLDALNRYGPGVQRLLVFPSSTSLMVYSDTGDRLQETPIEHHQRALTSPSFGSEGLIYTGLADSYGGRAAVIDPTKMVSQVILPRLLRGVIVARPVVFNDIFFVADETGGVYAINEAGEQPWGFPRFETRGPVTANLAADADGLYVASNDTVFYVLDPATGRLKWRYFAEVQLFRPAFPIPEMVLLPVEGRGVVALSKSEGATINREPMWIVPEARDVLGHDANHVYLVHDDGHIVAHEKSTGKELFRTQRNDFVAVSRNPSVPRFFAATAKGEVVAIEPILTRGRIGRLVVNDLDAVE